MIEKKDTEGNIFFQNRSIRVAIAIAVAIQIGSRERRESQA